MAVTTFRYRKLPGALGCTLPKHRKHNGRPRLVGKTKEPKVIYFFMGWIEMTKKGTWLVHHLKGGELGTWKTKLWAIRRLDIYNEQHGYIKP